MKFYLKITTALIIIFAVQNIYSQGKPTSIQGGIVNGKAIHLPTPVYPQEAKESCANGRVNVEVLISEDGSVISAKAVSGNKLLRKSAVEAVKKAKFGQTIDAQPIKIKGIIVYNFDSLAKCINTGIVNKKALNIPKPSLPHGGHPSHLKLDEDKIVVVEIVVDTSSGRVVYANAIAGHPLLRATCEMSARQTKFAAANIPPVKVKGLLAYKFKIDRTIETDIEKDDKDVAAIPTNLVKPPLFSCNCKFGVNPRVVVIADIDEQGNVVEAKAISGHPIFKNSSEKAAIESTFVPTNEKVKLLITYNFANVDEWSVKGSEIEIKNMRDIKVKK